ncbi:MAG: hypothetical protein K0U36_03285 [Alphaproteobacteria bacterium]|nr:hypothetical protein [Alphaproteobacteria bacterium]
MSTTTSTPEQSPVWSQPYEKVVQNNAVLSDVIRCSVPRATPTIPDSRAGILATCASLDDEAQCRALKDRLVTMITEAKETIFFISFLLVDEDVIDGLVQASQRGVRVYGMTAAEKKLSSFEYTDFDARVTAAHKKMLGRLRGKVSLRDADCYHAKLLLTDVGHEAARGILATANFTTEALMRNEECGVMLDPNDIDTAFEYLRYAYYELAESGLDPHQDKLVGMQKANLAPLPSATGNFLSTSPPSCAYEDTLVTSIVVTIEDAQETLEIATYGLAEDPLVFPALMAACQRGVRVRLHLRHRHHKHHAIVQTLVGAGAEVVFYRYLHAKLVIADASTAHPAGVMMSANLESISYDKALEYGVQLNASQCTAMVRWLSFWEQQQSIGTYLGETTIQDHALGEYQTWKEDTPTQRNYTIVANDTVGLEDVTAANADRLEADAPPSLDTRTRVSRAKQVKYTWRVVAPTLNPAQAKEVKETYMVEVEVPVAPSKPKSKKKGKQPQEQPDTPKMERRNEQRHRSYSPPRYRVGNLTVAGCRTRSEAQAARSLVDAKEIDAIYQIK